MSMFMAKSILFSKPKSMLFTALPLGFVYRSAAVDGFRKHGKSAAVTLTTQGEMCILLDQSKKLIHVGIF